MRFANICDSFDLEINNLIKSKCFLLDCHNKPIKKLLIHKRATLVILSHISANKIRKIIQ